MKKLITLIALVGLTIGAQAQLGPASASITLGTTRIDGSTATNAAYVIDCSKQSTVTVGYINQMATSSTAAQTIAYSYSIDGVNYSTALSVASFTPVASTQSVGFTNLNTYGNRYIKINYLTNAGAANAFATNTLFYSLKVQAP